MEIVLSLTPPDPLGRGPHSRQIRVHMLMLDTTPHWPLTTPPYSHRPRFGPFARGANCRLSVVFLLDTP
jgi:hypothetical protein